MDKMLDTSVICANLLSVSGLHLCAIFSPGGKPCGKLFEKYPTLVGRISETVCPVAFPFGQLFSSTCLLWQGEASRALPLAPSPIPAPQIVTFWQQKQAFWQFSTFAL